MSSVLDIGSGTGIWAIAAARLGAKRVVAIEREPLIAGVIRELAHTNSVSDRLEILIGDALSGAGSRTRQGLRRRYHGDDRLSRIR